MNCSSGLQFPTGSKALPAPEYVVCGHDVGVAFITALSTAEPEGFRGDTSSHLGHVLIVFAGATAQTSPPLPPTNLDDPRPTKKPPHASRAAFELFIVVMSAALHNFYRNSRITDPELV